MSEISKYMNKQLKSLISQIGSAGGKARLARLRRGAGKAPGEIPELWGEFLNGIPEEMYGRYGEPSRAEWAVYLALTMYALHQQGNSESIHSDGMTLGKAAAKLMTENSDDERERVLRRFGPIVTAKDMYELSHHLRCLIQLLASKGIRLDYVQLADDIYQFQFDSERKKIQLKWGRDFYYKENKGEDE
ncbi:type I-E CRISPR-associated protein Cse2/CasB [uncultured Ruminococcus sp.]|uniref:type I-E CRISPR-associated protein Cse2/CasB n=1 Tax=uncultured Ruminococcus sp. TaxID=165186 RepID=UPI0025F6BD9A|nr:type I-E CRISPR-associated protein Cse2/CasB [uncultured Ruminococcus sp.]